MRIGSLFSGIGGLELGLEWAGLGHTVWQVEIQAFCRAILAKHWPNAERFDDVCTVGAATLSPVDLICGGFPCQNLSSAGKREGLTGSRSGLWFEYLRIVKELHPSWVVVENVASGARAWVDTVEAGLEQLGYACLPIPLSASDVGAPHRRARVFIVAHTDANSEPAVPVNAEVAEPSAAADTDGTIVRLEPRWAGGQSRGAAPKSGHAGWGTTQPDMVRMVHGVPARLDGATRRRSALGNSVMPQQSEVVGWVIRELARAA